MSVEKLPIYSEFPAGKGQDRLVQWVKGIYFKLTNRINWLLDRVKDDTLEITTTDSVISADGNWRFSISGTDLLIQRRESSAWVTKSTIPA